VSIINLSTVEPFEICSIRPPTENDSLTFRLTRNCGWNQCLFCPVYKYGARFSRRSMEEVKKDVERARVIYDLLMDYAVERGVPGRLGYQDAGSLIREVQAVRPEEEQGEPDMAAGEEEDERLQWFSSWFKEKPKLEDSIYHVLTWMLGGQETCFLGDSNSLVLSAEFFTEVMEKIRATFPTLRRFTVYGRTSTAARKSPEHLKAFRNAGLDRVHFGLESGSDTVLDFMAKGVTAAEQLEGCLKIKDAGISCSVYVMPGLGGSRWSELHAVETAELLSRSEPDFVRLRSLEIFPKTGLAAAVERGDFVEATEEQVVREIRILVEQTEAPCRMVSDSASNLLDVNGRLPEDRDRMLSVIDEFLELSPREKLAFSLESRLRSFYGQYGGLTDDIMTAAAPYLTSGRIDISYGSDEQIKATIRLIRSKLMP
jgi:Radical SAM superfamily